MYHYLVKKKKGLAKLKKIGSTFVLTVIQFDKDTGKKKDPIFFNLRKEDLEKRKAEYEAEVADIDAILTDMKLLA